MATLPLESIVMTLDLEQPHFPCDPTPSGGSRSADAAPADSAAPHAVVERCEFEELLERAMEILKTRRVGAGSRS